MDSQSSAPPGSPAPDPEVTDLISITIKTIDSKNYKFEVESNIQIKMLKEKIAPQLQIEPESQRMIFCGRVLSDDKTLNDYKIDNGKVIHLVKRAPPRTDTTNNTSNNNQQSDRNRIRRFQNQDGSSVYMGTFSMDPSTNILNQVMRQLFSSHRPGSDSSVNSNNPSHIRARFNKIRQLLCYIDTNLQILQDPSILPSASTVNAFPANHTITLADYTSCFRDSLSYMDRLKTYLDEWLDSLDAQQPTASSQEDNSNNEPNNFSIIMRIVHHLSHVFHSLTDFVVDPTRPHSPISVNVLESNSNPNNAVNVNNNNNNENENNANPNANTNDETNNNNNDNAQVQQQPSAPSQQPGSNPIDLSSIAADMNTMGSRIGSFPSGVFVTQSPILLMEVDATINGNRTNLATQAIPNFSISDLNVTINNMINNASNFNFASMGQNPINSTGNSTQNSNNGGTTPSPIISEENSTPESRADNNSQAASDQNRTTAASQDNNDGGDATANPFQMYSMRFDPYLNCNSIYTLPELRSANVSSGPSGQQPFQIINSLNSNSMFSNLMNLFQTNFSAESNTEFFDLIGFLLQEINQTPSDNFDNVDSPRIGDYLRILNLVDSDVPTFLSEIFTNMFQNMNFEQLFQMINFNYHDFGRLRVPFQELIRNNILHGQEWTPENVRREIQNIVTRDEETLANVVRNIPAIPGIDVIKSFQNFIQQTLIIFFNRIMRSSDDASFENDLISAIKYLGIAYPQFCYICFDDPERARADLIINLLNQYGSFINERLRSFMSNIVIDRMNAYSINLRSADPSVIEQVNSCLVKLPERPISGEKTTPQSSDKPQPMESDGPEHDAPSNSYDSEEVEFSDAFSDMPSTSNQSEVRVSSPVQQSGSGKDWKSVVPREWIPIIEEDIQKQMDIDEDSQPPFSDAYLAGMPKKRRIEYESKRASGSK